MESPVYLSTDEITELHDRIIRLIGGMPGTRDYAALESCVVQPQTAVFGTERFETLYDKAAAYCFFIVRAHPFFDGNKRTGFLAALHFLRKNGRFPVFNEDETFDLITRVARGEAQIVDLARMIETADRH